MAAIHCILPIIWLCNAKNPFCSHHYVGRGYTKRRMPPHTSAYQQKDGVDDIGTIDFIVYRIYYILRSVYAKFCDKIIIITS